MDIAASSSKDAKTRATASDALSSKHAAVSLGYYENSYLGYFCKGSTIRRPPIINRGYYTRVMVFRKIIQDFLLCTASSKRRQIISLGCGFDTIAFEYSSITDSESNSDDNNNSVDNRNTVFFELDYNEIVEKKAEIVLAEPVLSQRVLSSKAPSTKGDTSGLFTADKSAHRTPYGFDLGSLQLLTGDLRDTEGVVANLQAAGVDWTAPTLVLTECVLVYMDKTFADSLCSALHSSLSSCVWASYDMINPTDSFGNMMAQNLREAGFHIPGFRDFPSLAAQEARFCRAASTATTGVAINISSTDTNGGINAGSVSVVPAATTYRASASCTMSRAHNIVLSAAQRAAADKIERLDEVEEWELLMSHYCITITTNDHMFSNIVHIFSPP